MKNFSLTQSGNLVAFAGLIVIVLKLFGIDIAEEEIQSFIGAFVVIIGIIVSWIGRYRVGDLKINGVRKTN